ncbi:MAG: hypothetical protein ACOX0F_10735 [Syntrophomonadaceae bacterium]
MRITLWPQSRSGKWSAGLSIAFVVLFCLKLMALTPMPIFAIAALGLAGFVIGILAMFKNKEKALLVFLSIPLGLLIIFWTAAEIMYPH